ncbi:hypothetical protein H7B90_02270 [Cohnella xylanilytica]|uniref:Uncharacterized protein n=1 Tax=Cohnella xylanilytica TaxID=557555 RepID=A0A841TPG5_9BACL|nr:hypothetical protein [Cohnella xylanilytica]MBB6690216.1 hypothetical protein [Cohnella xylanilytica]
MDPTDKELKEQLSQGPLVRNGFDDRLRKRIEDSLDRPRSRFGRTTRVRWSTAGAAALLLIFALAGIWHWAPGSGGTNPMGSHASLAGPSESKAVPGSEENEELRSALLLGLRKDVTVPDGQIVSTYRTVLVAPQDGKLAVAAQGPGIVMPYKQTFWKIESTADDGSTESQSLIAYQAYGSKALTERPASTVANPREGLATERILYVGKEYVSVAQEVDAKGVPGEYRFVKTIKQLAASAGTDFDARTEPHVDLETVLKDEAVASSEPTANVDLWSDASAVTISSGRTEQWAIVRKPGQWTGVTYAQSAELGALDVNTEKEVPVTMPNAVVPEDRLLLDWDQIRKIEPSATDAYMFQELLAAVVDREIRIYPYKQKNGLNNPLSLELEPNESIIMVEWALNQSETKNYADQWRTKVAAILGQS